MSFDEGSDYCRLRKFGETNGEQPVFALICDNDFPISYRERSCLNACKSHWDFSKGMELEEKFKKARLYFNDSL